MPLAIKCGLDVNALVYIRTQCIELQGPTHRILEDLKPLLKSVNIEFFEVAVNSGGEICRVFDEILYHAQKNGMKPIIHFDMHGSLEGLEVSGDHEILSWVVIAQRLRKINVATACNLGVVSGVCYGFHAIRPVNLYTATPFYVLIAPEEEVSCGFMEESTLPFYRELFSSGDILKAYQNNLSEFLKMFHCEEFLARTLCKYIAELCKGKSGKLRREQLLTKTVCGIHRKTTLNLRSLRVPMKMYLKPSQELVDRYSKQFLAGRVCQFTIDDLLQFVEELNKSRPL